MHTRTARRHSCALALIGAGVLAGCHAPPALAPAAPQIAPQGPSVEARLAAQNQLFEEQYESDLALDPESATAYGDLRYNDRLSDASLAGVRERHDADVAFLARLKALSTSGFAEQDELSHDVMLRLLSQRNENYDLKVYEMPVDQMSGPHLSLADLPLSMPFDSVRHYEDYIARLKQIPRAFKQTEEVLRAGMADRLMPVRFLLEKVPAQCEGVMAANPFLIPIMKFPDGIAAEERARLSEEIHEAIDTQVWPAYRSFSSFIADTYAPQGRTRLSVESLPGGEARYANDIKRHTTLGMLAPAEIHAIGVREVARIEGEMLSLAHAAGFADRAALQASVQDNPTYVPTSAEQILEDYRRYLTQMQAKLPALFRFLPGAPLTVEAIPDFQAETPTHYVTGTADGKRPGRVVVATADFAHRSLVNDEATAYHEGIPGHHLQLSVAQQLRSLPRFRQHGGNSGYVEGWALYAEQLGKEVGFYRDPVSDYGRLASELWRAIRLVVDTGIHAQGWSREQVVDYFRLHAAVDEPTLQAETDRYIAWPGQALGYKLGQLKFRELRERARTELGSRFDLRAFHDEMLSGGVLPLDLLDARTDRWILSQKR